jgi:dCTP deaminase
MAFWNSELIKQRAPTEKLLVPYDQGRVVTGAYELSLGSESYITSDPTQAKRSFSDGAQLNIPPGQFGMLMTKESICIPDDAIGFISIKATIKFQGLVNVSGFHVDPGWKGPLKFAVYNAGSKNVPLIVGERTFLLWFSALTGKTTDVRTKGGTMGLTREDIERIQGEVSSPAELKKEMDSLRTQLRIVEIVGAAVAVAFLGAYAGLIVEKLGGKGEVAPSPQINQVQPSVSQPAVAVGSNQVQRGQTPNAQRAP